MPRIRNYQALSRSPARRDALDIISVGLEAIDTAAVVAAQITLKEDILSIGYHRYNLSTFRHIHVIGFGKASCVAAAALEEILGDRIHSGIALSNNPKICKSINVCETSHPLSSQANVEHSGALVAECESVTADDLVIVLVSGGGSAMLSWPASEYEQGSRLYNAANRKGLTIHELNTVRKHISALKGGGLAKLLQPAKVVGLIFSDVPGDAPDMVASGPTYPDATTIEDAKAVIAKHDLGEYELMETPKDPEIFRNVDNIVLVSNEHALETMAATARRLGYDAIIVASDMYDEPEKLVARFREKAKPHTVVLGGGESRLTITEPGGIGGRNQHVALVGATSLNNGQVFASIASDGLDNGDTAGALVDDSTVSRAEAAGIDAAASLRRFDETPLLTATDDLVFTGATGSNVSDLMLLLTP